MSAPKRTISPKQEEDHSSKRVALDESGTPTAQPVDSEEQAAAAASAEYEAAEGGDDAAQMQYGAAGAPEGLSIRFFVPTKMMGGIIGRNGATIKAFREQSNCRINVSDHTGDCDRVLTLTGSNEEIFRATTFIGMKLAEGSEGAAPPQTPNPNQGQLQLKMGLPHSQAGAVIGKSGAKIKEIRDASGANVQLEKDMLPNSNERLLLITGSPNAVATAVFHICGILAVTPLKTQTILYNPAAHIPMMAHANPAMQPPMYSAAGTAYPAYPGYGAAAGYQQGVQHTQTMVIPNEMIGSIIGRGGAKIREIRQMSQANIKISDNAQGAAERQVTITGTPEACQTATYLIQVKMQEAMSAMPAAGGRPL